MSDEYTGWEDVPIPLLSDQYRELLSGTFAQCQSGCGLVFQDDIPIWLGTRRDDAQPKLKCPMCGAFLSRVLTMEQLHPKSSFPWTWQAAGHRSFSRVDLMNLPPELKHLQDLVENHCPNCNRWYKVNPSDPPEIERRCAACFWPLQLKIKV